MKRNLAFFRLAVVTNLEYRLNYFTDAILQPVCAALIELTLWYSIFRTAHTEQIGGFQQSYYLAYALWAPFVSRITSNWMYEFRMIGEIESGGLNSLLVRPMSFFEYYMSQLLGYKVITTLISMVVPIGLCLVLELPVHLSSLPATFALLVYYVILVYLMSFIVSTLAFHLTKVHSITAAKNLGLWLLSGELVPLDLIPQPYREWMIAMPFSSAVYLPVGYLTGRIDSTAFMHGFINTSYGIFIFGAIAWGMWHQGLKKYVGTGA